MPTSTTPAPTNAPEIGQPPKRRGRPPSTTPGWEERYLAHYGEWGSKREAARVAGVTIRALNERTRTDPKFAQAIEEAREDFMDRLEVDLVKMGRTKNNVIATIARLKAENPRKYHDKFQIESRQMNLNVFASAEEAKSLLMQMLAEATPATRAQLALGAASGASSA